MAPLLSLSQQLEVVEKVAMKGSLWLSIVKVNLIKRSLLLGTFTTEYDSLVKIQNAS